MRECPGCNRKFPHGNLEFRRKTARPVWTCLTCYRRERKAQGINDRGERKPQWRNPNAVTGTAGKCTPETAEKIHQTLRNNPQAIHRLCDLLEGQFRYATGQQIRA
jgi:hypothetical protein